MPLEIIQVNFDYAGLRKFDGWSRCFPRLRSQCDTVRTFRLGDHFSWQAQGKSRVLVVQEIGAALLRCADFVENAALFDLVVVFGVL